ncbi:hypothetical protein BGW80DRAFT_1255935 [Lactifluus volemus]|nr:hypothetical protein BGW80DRAFT_1255935 [Lactifluus volemus]
MWLKSCPIIKSLGWWCAWLPLGLLTLANFTNPPTQRGIGLLCGFGGDKGDAAQVNTPGVNPESVTNSHPVYPCAILHTGRLGGLYSVYTESTQAWSDWKESFRKRLGCGLSGVEQGVQSRDAQLHIRSAVHGLGNELQHHGIISLSCSGGGSGDTDNT